MKKTDIHREYFVPFLDQLVRRARMVSMNIDVDYRFLCESVGGEKTFVSPLSVTTHTAKMDKLYHDLLAFGEMLIYVLNDGRDQDELLRVPVMMVGVHWTSVVT